MYSFRPSLSALSFTFLLLLVPLLTQAAPVGLLVNGRSSPLGIGCEGVSFSWQESENQGAETQTAYQVQVVEGDGETVSWDSGKITSAEQTGVELPASVTVRSATRYRWKVRTWFSGGEPSSWSPWSSFETGLRHPSDWHGAQWIRSAVKEGEKDISLPLFRRTLTLDKKVARARLYATARGIYQIRLNGIKVGDQFLAPGWTDYNQKTQVQTYDVTESLKPGRLVLEASVGDGWYRGKVGLGWTRVYGEHLAILLYLHLNYSDGTQEDLVTDESWTCSDSPFVRADLQDGETYDARLETDAVPHERSQTSGDSNVVTEEPVYSQLVPQPDEPVRQTELFKPMEIRHTAPDTYQVDFGQNLVGVVRLRVSGTRGQTIVLSHAEERYRTGPQTGALYRENLRGAKAEDRYVFSKEGSIVYQPTFTQHGFRYVEVSGLTHPLKADDIDAIVLGSALPSSSSLETSNALLNRLASNVRWGQRGNFVSIPTDTPARDERLGWTGDIGVFSATACRLTDARAFLSKWLEDVKGAQKPDGNIPAVVPQPRKEFDETGVGWADAVLQVPYAVWKASGDTAFLKRHWPTIKRMYSFIHDSALRDGDYLEQGRASWFSGDWLSLEGVDRMTEHPTIATAYLALDSDMMAEMASALGETDFANTCKYVSSGARKAFAQTYVSPDGTLRPSTQTAYALALGLGIVEDQEQRQKVAARFVEKLESDRVHLRTGFLGTPWLLPALTSIGRDDLAMKLLLNEDYPSWGYEIRRGATTIWERWNSIQEDGSFGPVEMNSFNHYAYGAVLDWVYEKVGGLKILEAGYRRVRIDPIVDSAAMENARLVQKTSYGTIVVAWSRTGKLVHYDITLPSGCTAEFLLPEGARAAVGDSTSGSVVPPDWFLKRQGELKAGRHVFTLLLSDTAAIK